MKITKSQLKRIINEEIKKVLENVPNQEFRDKVRSEGLDQAASDLYKFFNGGRTKDGKLIAPYERDEGILKNYVKSYIDSGGNPADKQAFVDYAKSRKLWSADIMQQYLDTKRGSKP